jgi:hypothetical protein
VVKLRRSYNPGRLGNPELAHACKERYLRRQAEQLGFALTPVHGEVSSEQIARDGPDAARAWAESLRDPALCEPVKNQIAGEGNEGR